MPKRTSSYRARLLESLTKPEEAASYLNAAMEDSPEMFLKAVKDVAQTHQMASVAKQAGVTRESLYRSFSEQGNPTLETLRSVLSVFRLKMEIATEAPSAKVPTAPTGNKHPIRYFRARRVSTEKLSTAGQFAFDFGSTKSQSAGVRVVTGLTNKLVRQASRAIRINAYQAGFMPIPEKSPTSSGQQQSSVPVSLLAGASQGSGLINRLIAQ